MKFIISLLLTAIFAYALGLYLDWWSIAIAAFVVGVCIPQRPWAAFLSGGIAIALLWGGYSFFLNKQNDGLLATKIAFVLPFGGSRLLLLFVTALIGGLVASLAALSGSFLRNAGVRKTQVGSGETVILERKPTI